MQSWYYDTTDLHERHEMFRTAPAPTRGTNSFLLSLGLVNIPLAVYSGVESTRVERHEYTKVDDALVAVGRAEINKVTRELIERDAIIRMATATSGELVELTDDEIADATMPKGVAEVISFVPMSKLLTAYTTERVDQVRAKTTGLKPAQAQAAEHAFALFLAGLKARKVAALVKVALRGPARYAAITADGDMLMLHPSDGIRQPKAMQTAKLNDQELNLIGQLIDSYPHDVKPLEDDTAKVLQAFVDAKATGKAPTPLAEPEIDAGTDMLAALMGSIDARKVTA